jgi:hypothetical protein
VPPAWPCPLTGTVALVVPDGTVTVSPSAGVSTVSAVPGATVKVLLTGVLVDSTPLLDMLSANDIAVVGDLTITESPRYATDIPGKVDPYDSFAAIWQDVRGVSVALDPKKERGDILVDLAHERGADGVVACIVKFCETEEYQRLNGREQVLAFTRHILEFVPKYYNHIYAMKEIVIAVTATGIASDERFINECVMSLSKPVVESMKKGMKDGSVNLPNGLNENNIKMFLVVLRGIFEEYAEILKSKNEEAIKTVSSAIETLYAYLDAILKGIIKE